ncbi:MAG: chemotaxis protein CheW [Nitrospiraceae bacterium]
MLRAGIGNQQKSAPRSWNLLIFSVGGRRLAAKTDEVAGISEWKESVPVPSRTPFISSVVRHDQTVLPVFDLAELLHVSVRGNYPLCLTAKHPRGTMAICIDEEMPMLQTLDPSAIQQYQGSEFTAIGSFLSGHVEIPIIALSKLGSASSSSHHDIGKSRKV